MTDAELATIRTDAEHLATLRGALANCGNFHDAKRWQATRFEVTGPDGSILAILWQVSNEDPDPAERIDLFADPPEAIVRFVVEARNTPIEAHVLALLREVERLQVENTELIRRVSSNQTGQFKRVEIIKFAEFEREMTEEEIPEIVKEVERRRMLAAENRQHRLEMPTTDK